MATTIIPDTLHQVGTVPAYTEGVTPYGHWTRCSTCPWRIQHVLHQDGARRLADAHTREHVPADCGTTAELCTEFPALPATADGQLACAQPIAASPHDDCDDESDHEHIYIGGQAGVTTALETYGDAVGRLDLAAVGAAAAGVREAALALASPVWPTADQAAGMQEYYRSMAAAEAAGLRWELVQEYHDATHDNDRLAEVGAAIQAAGLPGLRVLTDGSYRHLVDVNVDRRVVTVTDVDGAVLEVQPGRWPLWRMDIDGHGVHLAPAALDAVAEQMVLRVDDDTDPAGGAGESLRRVHQVLVGWCAQHGDDEDVLNAQRHVIAAQQHLRAASRAAAARAALPLPATGQRVA